MINIYTDGACKDNNRNDGIAEGKGGWAFIVLESDPGYDMKITREGSGFVDGTTNQEMEIVAVCEAFESLNSFPDAINLYSDSAYVINCLKDRWYDKWNNNGWLNSKNSAVENRESWERLIRLVNLYNVNFFHVKRNTTKFIRLVDSMAKEASRRETSVIDTIQQ